MSIIHLQFTKNSVIFYTYFKSVRKKFLYYESVYLSFTVYKG